MVKRWREGTPAEFWTEFSIEGKHLSYTMILQRLRKDRHQADVEIAEKAKGEYGSAFSEKFSYIQGGVRMEMKDPTTIAKRYRELNKEGVE